MELQFHPDSAKKRSSELHDVLASTSFHRPDRLYGCTKEIPWNCIYKSSWWWTLGCSKHIEVTI